MTELKLGVAREYISPKVGGHIFGYNMYTYSTAIHDALEITAFAFSYGETKAVMINATICVVCVKFCDEIRKEIAQKTGIPYENITISATHTHTGPSLADSADGWYSDEEYYKEIFYPAAISASLKAVENIEPVKVAFGSGKSLAGINRRKLTLQNKAKLGQNPWAPFNPEMNLISFKNNFGIVVANIVSYSAHATAAGGSYTEISRDWPGVMTDALEQASGGLTAFFNTTMGDTGPRLSTGGTGGHGICHVEEIGNIAAKDALSIYDNLSDYEDSGFSLYSGIINIPVKPRLSYEEVCEYLDSAQNSDGHLDSYICNFYQKVKESYESGYVEKEYKEIPQTIVRIGNVAFAPFPFEMFTEIGLRIDEAVEDLKVITLSYTNGQLLYFPTEDQLCRGGHEVNLFKYSNVQQYADNADFYAVTQTLENIEKLER